jgi:hypothetical protein
VTTLQKRIENLEQATEPPRGGEFFCNGATGLCTNGLTLDELEERWPDALVWVIYGADPGRL